MFNDIDAAAGRDPIFDGTGEYGHGLEQTPERGKRYLEAVLELWLQPETLPEARRLVGIDVNALPLRP